MSGFSIGDEVKIAEWHGRSSNPAKRFVGRTSKIRCSYRDGYKLELDTPGAYWTDRELRLITTTKETKPMNVLAKIKELALDADTKLLKKYHIIDEARELTEEGKEVLLNHLFEQNKAAIVAKVKDVDADEKKAKKEAK